MVVSVQPAAAVVVVGGREGKEGKERKRMNERSRAEVNSTGGGGGTALHSTGSRSGDSKANQATAGQTDGHTGCSAVR